MEALSKRSKQDKYEEGRFYSMLASLVVVLFSC